MGTSDTSELRAMNKSLQRHVVRQDKAIIDLNERLKHVEALRKEAELRRAKLNDGIVRVVRTMLGALEVEIGEGLAADLDSDLEQSRG